MKVLLLLCWRNLKTSGGKAGLQVLWEDEPSLAGGPTCPQGLESRVGVRWVELFRGVQVSVGDTEASESELIYFFFYFP